MIEDGVVDATWRDIDDAVLAQVKESLPKGPPPNLMPPMPGRPGPNGKAKAPGAQP